MSVPQSGGLDGRKKSESKYADLTLRLEFETAMLIVCSLPLTSRKKIFLSFMKITLSGSSYGGCKS